VFATRSRCPEADFFFFGLIYSIALAWYVGEG
jgi:hypothetical protein